MATRLRDGTVLETKKSKVKSPPLFKVILLNDDYTPMEFVVLVLQTFFALTREKATQVMLKVHQGRHGSVRGLSRAISPPPRWSRSSHTRGSTSTRCSA